MKKRFKNKSSSVSPHAEIDTEPQIEQEPETETTFLLNKILQQLIILENKMDNLANSQPRQERHQRFDRPHFDRSRERDERSFTRVICADCHQECEVPFKPSGDRPVYCKDCFAKRKGDNPFRGERDNRQGERESRDENRRPGKRKKSGFRRRK